MDSREHGGDAHSLFRGAGLDTKQAARRSKARERAKARARRFDTIGHLGPEAVVAYVDGEMAGKPAHRVRVHLVHCAECREDVRKQRGAAEWVRECAVSDELKAPRDLLAKLAQIGTNGASCGGPEDKSEDKPRQRMRGAYGSEQDIFDKIEMIMRAIKHNQRAQ